MLSFICKQYEGVGEIHVCFDIYSETSLKFNERQRRGGIETEFLITGPDQAPKQPNEALLKNGSFKNELGKFLLKEWQKESLQVYLQNKLLFVSHGGHCLKIHGKDVSYPTNLQGTHSEADTLVAYHANASDGRIVIRATDTDVLIILLGMLAKHQEQEHPVKYENITMDVGTGNHQRYIDVSQLFVALEDKCAGINSSLLGLHSFSGSDYTSSFYRKGILMPFKLLIDKEMGGDWIQTFSEMAKPGFNNQKVLENFVCALYGMKHSNEINTVRQIKLRNLMKSSKSSSNKMKKVDCGLLPPCQKVLELKIKRSHMIARFWFNADQPNPSMGLNALNFGWVQKENILFPKWYDGSSLPSAEDLETSDGDEIGSDSDDETLEVEAE